MIHYHGTRMSGSMADGAQVLKGRHAFVSFVDTSQLEMVSEVCQTFAVDSGAFGIWKSSGADRPSWDDYYEWVDQIKAWPNLDWAIIPDTISGTEEQNDTLLQQWPHGRHIGVPVWHLHETMGRLKRLCTDYHRVAIGSSGRYSAPGKEKWWHRMSEAMNAITDDHGYPSAKLHGLRMLSPTIFTKLPLASADSTNVARNMAYDCAWKGTYQPPTKAWRGIILAERIESQQSPQRWIGSTQPTIFSEPDHTEELTLF